MTRYPKLLNRQHHSLGDGHALIVFSIGRNRPCQLNIGIIFVENVPNGNGSNGFLNGTSRHPLAESYGVKPSYFF
jgi:hypothetical protein